MKLIGSISLLVGILSSCGAPKTIYISNKTGSPITLLVDSSYNTSNLAFKDSLNGVKIEKKKVFNFGNGKWTTEDKTSLENLIKHTKVLKEGSFTIIDMPNKTKVSHIRFDVEELWVNIK
ncbi:hypothetical protein ACO2Q8_11165 [Larkinella sp. VNQ87]|uniref:hypothetical protein n=1 Tax=Larkinella sp. VNQ87 TaxID=3400921 RepID=UPI003BFE97F3